jgi:cytoskeletal protein CcmA (bactofilin family)
MSAIEYSKPQDALIIREGVTIKGGVTVPDTLVVSGRIEGDVSARKLVVGKTGAIRGKIVVEESADIFGRVFESLDVKGLLVLRSTSHVDGTVNYGLLQIEQGANLIGEIFSNGSQRGQKPVKYDEPNGHDGEPVRIVRGPNNAEELESTVLDFPTKPPATGLRPSGAESSHALSELLSNYLANRNQRAVKPEQSPLKVRKAQD